MPGNNIEKRRDIRNDLSNLSRIDQMWQISSITAAPNKWHIPEGIIIGIASRNNKKIQIVREAIEDDYYGKIVKPAVKIPEDGIKHLLKVKSEIDNIKFGSPLFDPLRVVRIAALKARTFYKDTTVTHALGLDTDVYTMGPGEEGPLGIPKTKKELYEMLEKISGKNIKIVSAGALVDFKKNRIVAIEALNIRLKLREFKPAEFTEVFLNDTLGKVAGGIDYSEFLSIQFLDENSPVIINRIDQFSQSRFDHQDREVWLSANDAPPILRECVKGSPQLIKWLVYNGLTNPQNIPIV